MTVVLLACFSAVMFGAMAVTMGLGVRTIGNTNVAAAASVAIGLAVALAVVLVTVAAGASLAVRHAWPFLLAGMLAPGASQILLAHAVRDVGASRTSVAVGAAPLVAIAIAIAALGEHPGVPVLVGAILIVAGGIALVGLGDRPTHVRRIGFVFAAATMLLFSIRDNLVRWLAGDTPVAPTLTTASIFLGGAVVSAAWLTLRRTRVDLAAARALAPAGIVFALSYLTLFEAYYRGRVSVVSPLVATESLWGVVLAAVFLGGREPIERRTLGAAALIVTGGVLIGVFR